MSREKDVYVPSTQNENIEVHGILRGEGRTKAALIVHGFNGRANGLLQYMVARDLDTRGYDSLRIDLSGSSESERNITDLSIASIARDITSSIDFLRKNGAERIAFLGHSIGAMAVFYASSKPDIAALWDPSSTDGYRIENWDEYGMPGIYNENLGVFVSTHGHGRIAPDSLFKEELESSQRAAQRFAVPTLIVNGGKSQQMSEYGRLYTEAIPAQVTHVVDQEAGHLFTEDNAMERLFSQTGNWMDENID